jgi:hypothetical protein
MNFRKRHAKTHVMGGVRAHLRGRVLIWIKTTCVARDFDLLVRVSILEDVMTMLKSLTIVAALIAGGTSLAIAQNGLPTGGESPVAGGAGGGGWGYPGGVYGYPGYPGYGYGYYPAYGYMYYPAYGYRTYPAYGYGYPAYGYR